jgi:hypothetical protein
MLVLIFYVIVEYDIEVQVKVGRDIYFPMVGK